MLPYAAHASTHSSDMILIPDGPFLMGTSKKQAKQLSHRYRCHLSWLQSETPQRSISLGAFRIDKCPVTNLQYHAYCQATGHKSPGHWNGLAPPAELLDHPVTYVSQNDARNYAKWAGKRLPTEAEWEKAARGVDGLTYPWGNDFDPAACHWDNDGTERVTGPAPVGQFPQGASPHGVLDCVGNVAEWCEDGPGEEAAFVKGGAWLTTSPLHLRTAARGMSGSSNNQLDYIGFRCVQDV